MGWLDWTIQQRRYFISYILTASMKVHLKIKKQQYLPVIKPVFQRGTITANGREIRKFSLIVVWPDIFISTFANVVLRFSFIETIVALKLSILDGSSRNHLPIDVTAAETTLVYSFPIQLPSETWKLPSTSLSAKPFPIFRYNWHSELNCLFFCSSFFSSSEMRTRLNVKKRTNVSLG